LGKSSKADKRQVEIEERTWTNLQGKQTKAKFLRMHEKNVILMRGGRVVTSPFESLSRADQDYVRDLLAERGEDSKIPDVTSPVEDFAPPVVAPPVVEPPPAAIANVPPRFGSAPMPRGPGPASEPAAGRGGSAFFERMRERDEQQRRSFQEQNQRFAEQQAQRMEQQKQRNAEAAQQAADREQQHLLAQQEAYHNELVGTCSNCKKSLTRDQSELKKCPHCGVVWEYEVDQFGHKREIPGAAALAEKEQAGSGSGWTLSSRGKVKLFTRIIIPALIGLGTLIFGAIQRSSR
jgi:hypothetical protein